MPNIKRSSFTVSGIEVELIRKNIKNLHLGVYPPNGRVRIAIPLHIDDEAARLAVVNKLAWIKKRIEIFENQSRLSEPEVLSGESWYFFGQRLKLAVVASREKPQVRRIKKSQLELHVSSRSSKEFRLKVINRWYRKELQLATEPIIAKWESRIGVKVEALGIKRMKTKWGSCNQQNGRIWINSELAKKPIECLEYIVVHELIHLIESSHNENFEKLLDKYLPNWKSISQTLNATPLAHENWTY